MISMTRVLSVLLLNLLVGAVCAGADGESEEPLPLSLVQALEAALEHNPEVQSARLQTRIHERGVAVAAARFGRSLSAGLTHQTQRAASVSTLESVTTATSSLVAVELGVEQLLASGARIDVGLRNRRSTSNAAYRLIDPVYESEFGVEVTQPLWRGRGSINRTDQHLARNAYHGAQVDETRSVRDLQSAVASAYWNLYFATENLAVQQQLAGGAERVLETARTRADMGAGPRSEILQAEVGVARRQEQTIVAEGRVHLAEDRLKMLTGLDRDPDLWDRRLRLTSTVTADNDATIDLRAGIERAVATDPDLQRGRLQVQSLELLAQQAQDLARPQVDLTVRAGVSGIGASYADNNEALVEADGRNWTGGLSLRIPLGTDPQVLRHRQRLLEQERGVLDLERRRLGLIQQVRQHYRQVMISRRRTEVSTLAVGLARQNVAEVEARQNLGLSSARSVLDAQDELAQTRAGQLQAVLEHRKALLEWRRLTSGV